MPERARNLIASALNLEWLDKALITIVQRVFDPEMRLFVTVDGKNLSLVKTAVRVPPSLVDLSITIDYPRPLSNEEKEELEKLEELEGTRCPHLFTPSPLPPFHFITSITPSQSLTHL